MGVGLGWGGVAEGCLGGRISLAYFCSFSVDCTGMMDGREE